MHAKEIPLFALSHASLLLACIPCLPLSLACFGFLLVAAHGIRLLSVLRVQRVPV